MSNIDNEILLNAEDDAAAIEFIQNQLPQDLKDKFSEDELYYFLDVIYDYYATSGIFDSTPDQDGYIDIDLDEIVKFIQKKAKKEGMGEYEHDDLLLIIQAEMDYSEQFEDEE
ncbi:MAG: hypothetical protein MJZ36_06585 [Bacteroidaceae bacterium]|nr:hypothetical protein [Bacteroidaceae bacterium]